MLRNKPEGVLVSFAECEKRAVGLEHLWEFASEEGNPGESQSMLLASW